MSPNPHLMKIYGTEDCYLEKQAEGTAPLAMRMAAAMLAKRMAERQQYEMAVAAARRMAENTEEREEDVRLVRATVSNPLRHTRAPLLVAPMIPSGSLNGPANEYGMGAFPGLPVGMDEGMVRMASAIGSDMASQEDETTKVAFGTPAAITGLALGLTGVGDKVLSPFRKGWNKVFGTLGHEHKPTDWGHTSYGAPKPAFGINEYGYAQRGTPFSY